MHCLRNTIAVKEDLNKRRLHHEQAEEIGLFRGIVRLYHGIFNGRDLVIMDSHSIPSE